MSIVKRKKIISIIVRHLKSFMSYDKKSVDSFANRYVLNLNIVMVDFDIQISGFNRAAAFDGCKG